VVVHSANSNICLLINLAPYRVLQTFTRFNEARDRRITTLRPVALASEQTALAVGYKDNDRRVDARENLPQTRFIDAYARVARRRRSCRRTAAATKCLRGMP